MRRRRTVDPIAVLFILAGAAPVIAGTLAMPWLPGPDGWADWQMRFDLFNNFLPLWAGLIALGLALALVRGAASRALTVPGGLLLLAALVPLGIELARAPASVEYSTTLHQGRAIRLIQFNALNENHDIDAALALVFEHDADLVMVQEAALFQRLEPQFALRYPFSTPCPSERCKAIIYSQTPPLEAHYDLVAFRHGARVHRLGVARMVLRAPDGKPYTALATHFVWPYPVGMARAQRAAVLEYLKGIDLSRAVIGGDFNLTPWTFEMRALDTALGDMRRVSRALFTFPVPFSIADTPVPLPFLPIDHVYAGSRWLPVRVDLGPAAGSDHYPVITELVMDVEEDRARGGNAN